MKSNFCEMITACKNTLSQLQSRGLKTKDYK